MLIFINCPSVKVINKNRGYFMIPRMFNSLIIYLLSALVISNANAENNFKEEFESFVGQQQEDFTTFVDQQDLIFLKMIDSNWREFNAMPGLKRDAKPKPRLIPHMALDHKKQLTAGEQKATPFIEPTTLSHLNEMRDETAAINFYGHSLVVAPLSVPDLPRLDQASLHFFWKQQSNEQYQATLDSFNDIKRTLKLSDWALWQLVKAYTNWLGINNNQQTAVAWFLLNKLELNVKVAYHEQGIVLLAAFKQPAYELSYFVIDNEHFYKIAGNSAKGVKTYEGGYKASNRRLNLAFDKTLVTKANIRTRSIDYGWNNQEYSLTIPYDLNRIYFYSTYPQIDLEYYFKAPVDSITAAALYSSFTHSLTGSRDDKTNHLLTMIHQAFPYAIDELQFGKENYLLPEETLHYQASDCEDRAVLMAWLARTLLNETVVGLDYPGHVATGLLRKGKIIVADPTYIGAKVGDEMPDFIGIKPKVIEL